MAAATSTAVHATTIDDFDVGQVIGRGGFGLVYRARHRATGKEVALKVLDKRALHAEGMAHRVVNEVRLHARAASVQPQAQQKEQQPHPHIVALLGFFEDDRSVYLILEHCASGNLYRYLKRHGPLVPEAAAAVIAQVLAALVHLHEAHGIVHRDLKLSNLLLLPGPPPSPPSSSPFPYTVKLADFGLAARLEGPLGWDAERFTLCGTPEYIAPEIAGQRHGRPVDLWSAGCILYSLLTGRAPFPRSSACGSDNGGSSGSGFVPPSPHTVWAGGYEPPAGLSAAGRDFLRRLLEPNPGRRPTARTMLAHPFLTGEHVAEEEEEHHHSIVGGHGSSASHLLDDSSVLTVVPSERRGDSSSLQGWSSSASVATRAPSLSSPPPPPPSTRQCRRCRRRRSSSSSSKAPPEKKEQQALLQKQQPPPAATAPAAMTLTIPLAAHGDDAEAPPPPHHRWHPRRSRTARAKAAQQMEMEQQQRRQQQGSTTVSSLSAPPPPTPFFLLQQPVVAAAATADPGSNKAPNNLPPLVPIDAARLPPGRFLLPHPSGQHEGLLRLKRDGRVSLKMRSLQQQDDDGWRWSLRIRPGGLHVRVAVAAVANPGYRSEEEYTLGDLPLAYHAAYRYCWRLVQGVRAMTPKMTLFLVRRHEHSQSQQQQQQQQSPQVLAKCMVMENGPLPDFKVRWADGAVLRYSLRTGQLTLALGEAPAFPRFQSPSSASPQEAQRRQVRKRRHAWVIGGMGMECAATGEAGRYLGQAQWAMQRCLQAEEALLATTGTGNRAATATFPVVLYDEVEEEKQASSAPAPVAAAPSPEEEYRSWPLVGALAGVGQARRSPRGDVAVALEGAGVVLILSPDATRLTALPDGAQYALPALTHCKTGARMSKSLRAQVRVLHRVLKAVGEGQNGV